MVSDREIAVIWADVAAADNGGTTLTGYLVTATEVTNTANTFNCNVSAAATACLITGLTNGTAYSIIVVARNGRGSGPASTAITATPRAAPANTPPTAQIVPENFTFKPAAVAAGGSFRLLFVTTETSTALLSDISTYNTFVQADASGGHSAIQPFSSEFRALISTVDVDARDNTATNHVKASPDPDAPIYWLGGDKVADDYDNFYDGGWDSVVGRGRDGNAYTHPTTDIALIWTGTDSDGTENTLTSGTGAAGLDGSSFGILEAGEEIAGAYLGITFIGATSLFPLYALSPILTHNQAPTVSTNIPDQTTTVSATFTYTFPDNTFADADSGDTITYSASENPDVTWLDFTPDTRTFSGMPTAADVDVITITVTASDGTDSVTDTFTLTVVEDALLFKVKVFLEGAQ